MSRCMWMIGLFWLVCALPACGQRSYRIVSYNVENLFDTSDDPDKEDDEFTPQGMKHWTSSRYSDKLLKLAQALQGVGEGGLPVFIGLTEVENRGAAEDLISQPALAGGDYGVIHQDSPDRRGIDVAFLYRKSYFTPLDSGFFPVLFPEDSTLQTRDILYVSGVLDGLDTLHFFLCHFPSMYGGEARSEWKRRRAAAVLRAKIDSLQARCADAAVVVLGDLNGKANTEAQTDVLGTKSPDQGISPDQLYNTGYYLLGATYGSYRYRGAWQTLDHIIVSGVLLNGKNGLKAEEKVSVFSAPSLLEEDKKYSGYKPRPTYRGPFYIGGCSDHLPLYLDLYRP